MSIPGKQTINIGLPNESAGSDSLYTAFTKTQNNFDTLFTNASPYNTFTGNGGIAVTSNANTGTVSITNTGVTNIVAGTNIVINQSNGNVTISSTGGNGNGGGTVTSVGLQAASNTRLTVTNSPIVSSGNMTVDLATSGVSPGSYTNPSVTVDAYGRVTAASNGAVSGTVTSVGLTAGSGIQVNGGPVTSSGNITVTNTGVVRLNAGTGISLSSGNGNVTISTAGLSGTVTSVDISSNQLVISNSPIVSSGTITVDLPNSATFSGNVTVGNLLGNLANGNSNVRIPAANGNVNISAVGNANILVVTGTGANITGTANVSGNANVGNLGTTTAVITTGNITTINTGLVQNGNSNIAIAANANITFTAKSNATLVISDTGANITGTANITGNANVGNLGFDGGEITGTGNITAGNLVIPTGNIIYTPRYGAFYSNADQTNPVANTAMAMTFNNTTTANGVSVVSNSQLTIAKPGVYNIQFSAQIAKTGGGTSVVDIWLSKGGTPVDWTNTTVYVTSGNPKVAAWNFVENVTVANTYFEIMWSSIDTLVTLEASAANTSPTRPGIPSVIVSVVPVGA